MRLLMTTWAPAYVAGDGRLYVFISARMVLLSLLHGNTETSAYAYVVHGVTVGAGLGDYRAGFEFGRLALAVNERFNDRALRAKVQHMFGCFLNLWREPLETCLLYSRDAYRSGLETGDFAYATYAIFSDTWHALACSTSLQELVDAYRPNLDFLHRIKNDSFADAQEALPALGAEPPGQDPGASVLQQRDLRRGGLSAARIGARPSSRFSTGSPA